MAEDTKKRRGRPPIEDEFTHMPISRQYRYALRNQKAGFCINCPEPLAPGSARFCVKHKEQAEKRKQAKDAKAAQEQTS